MAGVNWWQTEIFRRAKAIDGLCCKFVKKYGAYVDEPIESEEVQLARLKELFPYSEVVAMERHVPGQLRGRRYVAIFWLVENDAYYEEWPRCMGLRDIRPEEYPVLFTKNRTPRQFSIDRIRSVGSEEPTEELTVGKPISKFKQFESKVKTDPGEPSYYTGSMVIIKAETYRVKTSKDIVLDYDTSVRVIGSKVSKATGDWTYRVRLQDGREFRVDAGDISGDDY